MPAGSIQFNADSSQLTTAAQEARQSVSSVAVSAEDARKKIVASYQAQVAAAKEAGASQRQLEQIATRSASTLANVTEDSARRYINAVDRMEESTRRFNVARATLSTAIPQQPVSQFTLGGYGGAPKEAEELSTAIRGVGDAAGYSVAPSVRFGSVLRGMQGNFTRNIRSAEYFGASLKFLGPVMEAAFPVVGAVALGYAIFEMGEKAYDAFENIVLLRDAIKGLNQLQINVDSTVTKNADAAEASVESILNQTQGKTAAARQKYAYAQNKPLDNSQYFYSKEFSGLTDNVKADYEKRFKSIAPNDINNSKTSIDQELSDLKKARDKVKTQGGYVNEVGGYNGFGDLQKATIAQTKNSNVGKYGPSDSQDPTSYYDARIKALEQIKQLIDSGATSRSASLQADQTAIPFDQAEETKKKAAEAKTARDAALSAQKQANAKAITQQNDAYRDWAAFQDRSKLDEVLYWSSLVALRNDGSARALDATKKYNDANIALNRENAEKSKSAIGSFSTDYMKDFYENSGLSAPDTRKLSQSGSDAADYIASLRNSIDLQKQDSDALAENSIQMALATGQMTKLDAARAMAALHQQQYLDSLKELNGQKSAITNDPTISAVQRTALLQDNANQAKSLTDNYGFQQQQDKQAYDPARSSPLTGAENALNDFAIASKNAAGMMQDIVSNTLNGLNNQLVNAMTGGKTNFKQFGIGVTKDIAGAGLKTAEGSALSLLSGGKLGGGKLGSKGNPIYTRPADKLTSISSASDKAGGTGNPLSQVSKIGGDVSSIFGKTSSGVSGFLGKAGGVIGGLVKTVLPFLATGGDFSNGAVVGEAGPEIVTGAGHVTSNRNLMSMLGSGNGSSISYSIDARGTDPVQTEMRVKSAIAQSHKSAVHQAVVQQQQKTSRTPIRR